MGEARAPVFTMFMEHRLPVEICQMIFQQARTSDRPYVQWKRAPTSARIFKPNGAVTDVSVGDFFTTSYPNEFCFRIDAWGGDVTADGPMFFTYSLFDMKKRAMIEHEFTLHMGTTRRIMCYPFGMAKSGNHLNNEAWSAVARIPDPTTRLRARDPRRRGHLRIDPPRRTETD